MQIRLFATVILFFVSTSIWAQEVKQYHTKRIQQTPHIDGLFEDVAWSQIEWEGGFIQYDPEEGEPPSQATFFKIVYDDDNIYVAIRAMDTEPEKIVKRLSRRDGWQGDITGVHFDSYYDKRTSFAFAVSAAGVKNDGFFSNDSDDFDASWDPIWKVKTKITAEGWQAEMEIPLSQLRFNDSPEQIWGLEVIRNVFRKDEMSLWQPISKKSAAFVSKYGELRGIKDIKPRKQIEIAPFVVGKYEHYEPEEGNPFADGTDFVFNGGVDGKIGLTNDLILDFAINPDFGQVEADPSEVNLSAFETYFSEHRPFFIEGNNITSFQLTPGGSSYSNDNLFYSRRVGRAPQGYPDTEQGEYVKIPENTKILGAFKVTGKTKKGWSVGIIENLTNREKAIIDNDGERRKESVEPLTNYFVARIQKDINKGNTLLGGMITSTYRNIKNEDLLFLPKTAITGGIDFTQYFNHKKYFLTVQLAASKVKGTKKSIERLQKAPTRYFQRPDAGYLTFDINRKSLSGTGATLTGGKQSSEGWSYVFNTTYRSPGLELNDVGFLRKADQVFQYTWVGYRIKKPFFIFRSFGVNLNQWAGWDFGGNTLFKGGNINLFGRLKNLWFFGFGINIDGQNISNTALRGGQALVSPGGANFWTNLSTNSNKKLSGSLGMSLNKGKYNYQNYANYWGGITYRPTNTVRFSLFPELSHYVTELQYVTQKGSPDSTQYIFAGLNQKTLNLTMRLDLNITPDLTVQYYASPYVSSILYDDFKKITDSKAALYKDRFHTFDSEEISFDSGTNIYTVNQPSGTTYDFFNPDFNFHQFRSNMVLRWEYIPGSTLFLVWSQGRTDYEQCDCKFNLKDSFTNLFKITPNDIFLVKVAYRFRG